MNAVKERLKAEAAKAAQAAQQAAQAVTSPEALAKISELKEKAAAHGAAAAKAAEERAAAAGLGKSLESARSTINGSFSNLSSLMRAGDEAQEGESEDSTTAEDDALMGGDAAAAARDKVRAGLSAFGSKLSTMGLASKAKLEESLDTARQASASVASAGASVSQIAREASSKSLDSARQAGASVASAGSSVASKGADGLRTAAAVGSSGVDKLKSATLDAKGALSAAAEMSGVGIPGGQKEPKGPCHLTYRQRLTGCVCCMLAGTVLSLLSLGSIAQLILGNPGPFAFKYSIGNLLSLGAASFLVGPRAQARGMLHPSRRVASLVYLATLVGTLVTVFAFKRALLSLLFIVLQFLALTWCMRHTHTPRLSPLLFLPSARLVCFVMPSGSHAHRLTSYAPPTSCVRYMLSYIPYGQTMAKKLLRKLLRRQGLIGPEDAHASTAVSPAAEG